LTRRDRTADNGLNERMIVAMMQGCPALGTERVSLRVAVVGVAGRRGDRIRVDPLAFGSICRLWCRVLLLGWRWWRLESLYRFNDAFAPSWQLGVLSCPRARDLSRVARAVLDAEAVIGGTHRVRHRLGGAV